MPARPSPIPAAAQRPAASAALAPGQCRSLLDHLAHIADPRQRRGRRHPLVGVLGVAVCAVLAGAKSLAAIGEWAADAPGPVLATLGTRRDPLTDAWLAAQQPPPPANRPPSRRAVAVDGKTLRGSSHHQAAPMHLLAAMDHATGGVLAQTEVDGTTNEITRFRPLLDGLDLAGLMVTADALHTQREQVEWLVTAKHAAYLLVVKANQPTLHRQLQRLAWPDIPRRRPYPQPRPRPRRVPPTPGHHGRGPGLPMPPRRSASPAGSGRVPAAAGAP